MVTSDTNPGLQPFGFAGGLCDDDTGLVRFEARDGMHLTPLGRHTQHLLGRAAEEITSVTRALPGASDTHPLESYAPLKSDNAPTSDAHPQVAPLSAALHPRAGRRGRTRCASLAHIRPAPHAPALRAFRARICRGPGRAQRSEHDRPHIASLHGGQPHSYDPKTGLLASMTGGGETIAYAYTGDIPTGSTWSGVFSGAVAETLDDNFRVTRQTAGGVAVDFAYDNDGFMTVAGDQAISRDAGNGLVTGTAIGTLSDVITHNDLGEPETYTANAGAEPLYSVSFARDGLGRIATRTETVLGETHTDEYSYDERGRLTSVVRDGTEVGSYGYDANDNRTSVTDSKGIRSPTYDAQDRLLTDGAATYTYTDAGSLLTKTIGNDTTTYAYTALGGLSGVTLPDGTDIEYVLDATHRRVGKRVDGTLTQGFLYGNALPSVAALGRAEGFLYRTYVPVLAELDGSGAMVSRFVYASQPFVPDYMIRGGTTYQLISDERGSVRLVVDVATGDVAQRIDYDAWGVVTADTNPGFQPFGFAGGLYDSDTGLVRFGARDYDPSVGRWTAKDPIRFAGGQGNLYAYVGGDPVSYIDPTGVFALNAAGAVVGAVSGGVGGYISSGGSLKGTLAGAAIGGALGLVNPWHGAVVAAGAAGAASLLGQVAGNLATGNPWADVNPYAIAGAAAGAGLYGAFGASAVAARGGLGICGEIVAGAGEGIVVGAAEGAGTTVK